MNSESNAKSTEPLRRSDQIDILCDGFELDLRQGNAPRIEDVLNRISKSARANLLFELVALEVDFLRTGGHAVDLAMYLNRFPEDASVIHSVRAELDWSTSDSDRTPSAGEAYTETTTIDVSQPKVIGHFALSSLIGRGGFGAVWRAFDTRLQRHVAVKIPLSDQTIGSQKSEFLSEARAAASLRHPNIVAVHEVGEASEANPLYIVCDLIDGPNLKNWLCVNRVTWREAAEMIARMAMALHHAHSRGIVHRDVKPSNVLLGSNREPHIADFGLAKCTTSVEWRNEKHEEKRLIGTPPYMSPEQARGDESAIDARSDIYSLGVVMFELLTGKRPFGGDLNSLLEKIIHEQPMPPRQFCSSIPPELNDICLRCLAKAPGERYQTAALLAEDLQCLLRNEIPGGVAVSTYRRTAHAIRRHTEPLVTFLVTATVCSLIGASLWLMFRPHGSRRFVEFSTDPPGSEITVVSLDSVSGEPDSNHIEHARGKTPLKMKLLPGDYLVVAVLGDRFHEVIRHVPSANEGSAFLYPSSYSKLHSDGCLRFLGPIIIPESEHDNMVQVPESDRWSPYPSAEFDEAPYVIPSFLVEPDDRTMSKPILQGKALTFKDNTYFAAQMQAESMGKRLPSSVELAYLIDYVSTSDDGSAADIRGVFSDPWEWTSTKSTPAGSMNTLRVQRGGTPPVTKSTGEVMRHLPRLLPETSQDRFSGVRCVRSLRPRLTPTDFVRHFNK